MYSIPMIAQLILKLVLKIPSKYLTLIVVLILTCSCQPQEDNKLKKKHESILEKSTLIFLVHPYDTPSQLISRFQPLCDYLEQKTGNKIKLELASSYVDQIKRISQGTADLAYMGPTPFLRAQDNYLVEKKNKLIPIVAEAINGKAGYHSVIVVSSSADIKSINQLKNHQISFAFGAPHSFSSHYAPRTMLASAKIGLSDLQDYAYLGSHERVALAVLHGDFIAGGLRQTVAKKYATRTPGLRIIATSPQLPPHLIVARIGLNKEIIEQIRNTLLSPSNDFEKVTANLGKDIYFIMPDLSLFNSARKVIKVIEARTEVPKQW